jgi:hypothetical protein
LQTKIDAYLDKTPISIASLLPKDQSAISGSNAQFDRPDDPLEDDEEASNDNHDRDGYDDDEISDDQDDEEDDDILHIGSGGLAQ